MPKMYFLVFRRIHVPAQIVAGTEQQAGKLAQGKLKMCEFFAANCRGFYAIPPRLSKS
jgi:hypothetical protein